MKKKLTILAVLVLTVAMSAYSVAGTYAKYTTTSNYSDSARVAKWGIKVGTSESITMDLFKDSYLTDTTHTDVAASTKVVAPGTTGSYEFAITGTPEVNYTVSIKDTEGKTKIENADLKSKVLFQVVEKTTNDGGNTYTDDSATAEWVTIDKLVTKLNDRFAGKVFAAGSSLESKKYVINWKWEIGKTAADDTSDTTLGNIEVAPTVVVDFDLTATQSEDAATA